jgi:predicted NUDIX family NTP pyrophosphohydrolase
VCAKISLRHKSNITYLGRLSNSRASRLRALSCSISLLKGNIGTMRVNAGVVVWRYANRRLQILLVHQADKPKTLWSIPKGGVAKGEDHAAAARREVLEEANVTMGALDFLGYIDYGLGIKRMYVFMGACPDTVDLKWRLPEIDKAGFFDVSIAKKMVDKRQRGLIRASQKILAFAGVRKAGA